MELSDLFEMRSHFNVLKIHVGAVESKASGGARGIQMKIYFVLNFGSSYREECRLIFFVLFRLIWLLWWFWLFWPIFFICLLFCH